MENGEVTGSGDGFRVGIGNGVGGRGRGEAGGERGVEKHTQRGERIKWSGMERCDCLPLGMSCQTGGLLRKYQIVKYCIKARV